MWYDTGETLSYNCLFNFIIGSRGCGKTYGWKKRAIKQFLDKGYEFVYLRRFQEELTETAESYFNDIILNGEFPGAEIKYNAGIYTVNGKTAGYAMALTKAKDYKSISYPKVMLIIFDEFLIEDNGFSRYLKNEVKQFLNFYMSIDRYRGVTVAFLANSVSMINPYTLYWDLQLPFGSNIVRKGDVLLQLVQNEEFINARKQTRFGRLVAGTEFEEYAIENKFTMDNKNFIQKKTGRAHHYFSFVYMGETFGVWIDYTEGKYFVSMDVDPSNRNLYSLTVEDHSPNTMLLNNIAKSFHFKPFLENYKMGNVYFESQRIKNAVYEVIRMIVR